MKKSIILGVITISALTSFNAQAFELGKDAVSVEPLVTVNAQLKLDQTNLCGHTNRMTLTMTDNVPWPASEETVCIDYHDENGLLSPTLAKKNAVQAIKTYKIGYICDLDYDYNFKNIYPRGIDRVEVTGNVINKTFICD